MINPSGFFTVPSYITLFKGWVSWCHDILKFIKCVLFCDVLCSIYILFFNVPYILEKEEEKEKEKEKLNKVWN